MEIQFTEFDLHNVRGGKKKERKKKMK